jgi:hypothetical protein
MTYQHRSAADNGTMTFLSDCSATDLRELQDCVESHGIDRLVSAGAPARERSGYWKFERRARMNGASMLMASTAAAWSVPRRSKPCGTAALKQRDDGIVDACQTC